MASKFDEILLEANEYKTVSINTKFYQASQVKVTHIEAILLNFVRIRSYVDSRGFFQNSVIHSIEELERKRENANKMFVKKRQKLDIKD